MAKHLTFIPLIDVPIFAAIVLIVSIVLVYAAKKVPILKKLVG